MRLLAASAFILVATASHARAAPSVELAVERSTVYRNEAFFIELRVVDFTQAGTPGFPEIENARVSATGQVDRWSTGTGRSRIFRYQVIPTEVGTLEIPPVTIVVDGKQYRTETARLAVEERVARTPGDPGGADEVLRAEIVCDEENLYVGQSARFTLAIWIKPVQVPESRFRRTDVWNGSDMYRLLDARGRGFPPFPAASEFSQVRLRDGDGDPQLHYLYEMSTELLVDKPGPVEFPDIDLTVRYPTRFRDNLFGEAVPIDARIVRVEPVVRAPEARALPADGRPANFTGVVGRIEIRTSVNQRQVRVGDPIELEIEVTGQAPFETLPAPDLANQQTLARSFRVADEPLAGELIPRGKRFTQVIRAKRSDVDAVPAIEYPYFDPRTGEYRIAQSEPIPLRVSVTEQLDASELVEAIPESAEPAVAARDALRPIETDRALLLATQTAPGITAFVVAATAPPAAFLLLLGTLAFVRLRSRDPREARRHGAAGNALRRIAEAADRPAPDQMRAIEAALAGYLADRLDQPRAHFTGRTAVEYLRGREVPAEFVERCATLVQHCEQAAYGGQTGADALADEARRCIHALEETRL